MKAKNWILTATILGSSLAFIDSTVVNVALPALQSSFHATLVDVQWVVEAYGLFLGALILVGGSLGDLFGRRMIFVVGVAIFAMASIACGLSSSIHLLVVARSVQGMGAALLVPGSLAIISASFDESSRGQAIGTWSGFTAITAAFGPVLGGWMIEHLSWRAVFYINVPLALAVVVISMWQIPESRGSTMGRIDWLGAILATVGLGGVIGGCVESGTLGWRNPVIAGSLIAGFAALAAFVYVEAKVTAPMFPLKLFSSASFSGANLLTLFLYSAIGIFFFVFPLNLIQVQGYSTTVTGAAMLPFILLMFFLSHWSGGLVARYGARRPLILGPLVVALGFSLFVVPSVGDTYWRTFFPAAIILGFGMAITVAPLTTVVMNSVGPERVGAASGVNNAVARVAGVLAVAVLGIVMISAFGRHLDRALAQLPLPPDVLRDLRSNTDKLGGLQLPAGLDLNTRSTLKAAVAGSFVYGFRIVMWICAGLSLASSGVAWQSIEKESRTTLQTSRPASAP